MKARSFVLGLVLVLLASGCGKQESSQSSETATSGSFELVADETLKPALDSLIVGFMSESPNAKVTVKYVSAAEAVRELLNKQARAVIIARGLTPSERAVIAQDSVTLPDFAIAEDGIGCIISSKNPLAAMRLSDLRKIARGDVGSWDGIVKPIVEPGPAVSGPIEMIFPAYPSSTEYVLDSMFVGAVMLDGNNKIGGHPMRFSSSDSVIAYVQGHPNSIGFIGSAWKHMLDVEGDSGIKVLPIIPADSSSRGVTEPILLHMAYIYEGLYPLVTPVNGFSFEAPNTVPQGLLSYAMTAHGQMVFKNFDVLPKTQIIHLVPPKQ
jgi:ABC-type phosphate transport system substrate-binding protein